MTLVYISGALVVGILAGLQLDLLPWPFFIAAGLVLIAGLLLRTQPRIIYLFLLAALLVGIGRGATLPVPGPPEQLQALAGSPAIVVSGIVDDYPESRGALTQFRFSVERYRADGGWVETSGLLLVRAKPSIPMIEERSPPFFRYGDTLVLKGTLEQPPVLEEFDWREHLAREGVHYLMFRPDVELTDGEGGVRALGWVYRVREEMAASLGRSLPEPRASLAQALLLGIRGGLPSELREDFAKTGTTHLIAISGLHVGILVGLVSLASAALLGRRGQIYIVIPLLFVWGYAVLTGFSPPVARAAIMASLYLWAIFLGRQRSGLTALSAAAALMVTVDPDLLEEVSFQLSFLAMAGLLLLGPWFRAGGLRLVARYWEPVGISSGIVKFFVEASAISLAVILATFPIVGFNFQFLSPVGLPATVFVLPALPLALVSSLAVAVAGIFSETAGQILAWGTWPWFSWMTGVIRIFSWVPGLKVDAGPTALYARCSTMPPCSYSPVVGAADVASRPGPIRAARIPDTALYRQTKPLDSYPSKTHHLPRSCHSPHYRRLLRGCGPAHREVKGDYPRRRPGGVDTHPGPRPSHRAGRRRPEPGYPGPRTGSTFAALAALG